MSKSVKLGAILCSVSAIIGVVMLNHSDEIRTTEKGLEIIGNAEGCRRDAYKCPADVITIGIGSTESGGDKIDVSKRYSDEEIAERWVKDLKIAENCVNRYGNGRNMPQGAFEAMTSITFNVGCGTMRKSTMFRIANTTGYTPDLCNQFPRWVYAGGKNCVGWKSDEKKKRRCVYNACENSLVLACFKR